MSAQQDSNPAVSAANELYWGSGQSVNKIAEHLELSKSALYNMIRPLPLGLSCPLCRAEVASSNRTAQDKRVATCGECSWEGPENDTYPLVTAPPTTIPPHTPYADRGTVNPDQNPKVRESQPLTEADLSGFRTMATGAFFGAMAGLALVLWTWRR